MRFALFNLSDHLSELAQQGLYRTNRTVESPQGVELMIDGKKVINFCSNDYLGLANHPKLIEAYKAALDKWGVGSGAAHLVCGHSSAHHALEDELAAFTKRDRALLFSTGYMANMGVISALVGRGDMVFGDRLNHASLLDGGLLSGARLRRYGHGDCANLTSLLDSFEQKESDKFGERLIPSILRQAQDERNQISAISSEPVQSEAEEPVQRRTSKKLIVTDGIFSMDGDIAPLPELVELAKEHKAWLMVDDAHGLGVLGDKGRGTLSEFQLNQDDVPILVGTLGKAFGTFGAFVAGSNELIEYLTQKARTYIYTTAMPPALAEATRTSLQLIQTENWRREKLNALISRFRTGANHLGLTISESTTPIQPLIIGDSQRAVDISNALFDKGFLISAIRPPTVPKNSARLRITFSAAHEEQHIDRLLEALSQTIE